jgi:hypothetical protein
MNRPREVTVRTYDPQLPNLKLIASVGGNDLRNVTLSRHPTDENRYGISANVSSRSQLAVGGLVDFLKQNGIEPIVTKALFTVDAQDCDGRSDEKASYIAAVEVSGEEAVDRLIALSQRIASATSRIGNRESKQRSVP